MLNQNPNSASYVLYLAFLCTCQSFSSILISSGVPLDQIIAKYKWIIFFASIMVAFGLCIFLPHLSELSGRLIESFFVVSAVSIMINQTFYFWGIILMLIVYLSIQSSFNVFPQAIAALLAIFLSISSIATVPNLREILGFTSFIGLIAQLATAFVVVAYLNYAHSGRGSRSIRSFNELPFALVYAVMCYVLSFRSDQLFIPGSEYHWEYFLGPIRALHDGYRIYIDTPSQYGLLNIYLASLISSDPLYSFYIFQSTLLFFVMALAIPFAYSAFPTSKLAIWLILTTFAFSMAFADPTGIGPQPYPSSSVVRFAPVYFAIFCSVLCNRSIAYACISGVLYAVSVLWSAESAMYSTIIHVGLLAVIAFSGNKQHTKTSLLVYVCINILVFIITLTGILAIIGYNLSQFVDVLRAHFEFALGYAGGFGYIPLDINGPIYACLSLIACGIYLTLTLYFSKSRTSKLTYLASSATLGLIAVLSYYIGRPVPSNITALLPLIYIISLIYIYGWHACNNAKVPSYVIATPALFCILVTTIPISPYVHVALNKLNIDSEGMVKRWPTLDLSTFPINQGAKLSVIGRGAAFPHTNMNVSPWLPGPIQMLQEPLAVDSSINYLKNYLCRKPVEEAYIIVLDNDSNRFLGRVFPVLEKVYKIEKVNSSFYASYRLNTSEQTIRSNCALGL